MKKSIENWKSFLMEKRLCYSCYGSNHIAKGCKQKKTCKTCNKKHPTALHIPDFKISDNKKSSTAKDDQERKGSEINNGCISQGESVIYHAILPVRVSNVLTNLIVTDLNDENPVEVERLYTREFIPVEHKQIPTPEIVSNWIHLENVSKEIPKYRPDLEIGLLIGNNCIPAHELLKVISSNRQGPFAVLLSHGWTVGGPLCQEPLASNIQKVSINRVVVREIQKVKEIVSPKLLLDALAIDFN
jgi:hypothetical protein